MREDHLTEAGSMELAWIREDGCGPDIRNVSAKVFLYDKPGPVAHVGLHVEGLGGPSLPVDTARTLAAMLVRAAALAERDGAPAPVATPEELATFDWFCSYCGEKVDEQSRDVHVRTCAKHPAALAIARAERAERELAIVREHAAQVKDIAGEARHRARALEQLLAIVANLTPAHESSTGGCSRNCTACQVDKVRRQFDALGGTSHA